MTWEIRSESPGCLAQMDHLFLAEVDALRGLGDFSLEVIGERPWRSVGRCKLFKGSGGTGLCWSGSAGGIRLGQHRL